MRRRKHKNKQSRHKITKNTGDNGRVVTNGMRTDRVVSKRRHLCKDRFSCNITEDNGFTAKQLRYVEHVE